MMLQGFGGPCCARILTAWFASKERGTYWGMWNIAHNLGGFSAPVSLQSPRLAAPFIEHQLAHHSCRLCGPCSRASLTGRSVNPCGRCWSAGLRGGMGGGGACGRRALSASLSAFCCSCSCETRLCRSATSPWSPSRTQRRSVETNSAPCTRAIHLSLPQGVISSTHAGAHRLCLLHSAALSPDLIGPEAQQLAAQRAWK